MTVDFKICYINVGIVQNMVRTNTLQIRKSPKKNTMRIVCRSFSDDGRPMSFEYPFSQADTLRIERDVGSFQEANLLTHTNELTR